MTKTPDPLIKDATQDGIGLTHIDRYEVQEQIGAGAMGLVYRVHDPVFACDRALKILRPELISETETIQRFRDEGRAAVKASGEISHPNIITVYDVGEFKGRPYIVMELFRGIALDVVLSTGPKLDLLKVLQIGEQLAGALDSAHKHGVVHRDIKPGNVLLSEDATIAKLTDFSVAQMQVGAGQSSLTRTGIVIGAPRYMPPEQALGQVVDGRSDLYGLGIMLYEMLTGDKAYKSETFTALLIEITQSELIPIKSVVSDVPPGVIAIVNKLVEKNPGRRFQTAGDLRQVLKREIRDYTIEQMKGDRSFPLELIGAGVLSLLVAGLLGLTGYLLKNQQVEALEQQTAAIGIEYAQTLGNQISFEYARNGQENAGLLYQTQFSIGASNDNFAYQHIVLNDGRILASTDASLSGQAFDEGTTMRLLNKNETDSAPEATETVPVTSERAEAITDARLVREATGSMTLQVSQPLETGPPRDRRRVGTLYVGFPVDRIQNIGRVTMTLMFIMTAMITALVALLAYMIIRYFLAPIKRLRDIMQVTADGDSSARLPAERPGVPGEAFRAFNTLAASYSEILMRANLTPTEYFGMSDQDIERVMEAGPNNIGEADSLAETFEFELPTDLSPELAELQVDDRTIILPMGTKDIDAAIAEAVGLSNDKE